MKKDRKLSDIKPLYTCDCGEKYMFLIPANCEKCGYPIVPPDGCVKFDPYEYKKWKESTEGKKIIKEIEGENK